MEVYGNVAIQPTRKESRTTGKGYYEFRLAESQRGHDPTPTWYSVRLMADKNPMLERGDFVKVTGKLKTDFYFGKDGKPSGTLLIIAFQAAKIAKPTGVGPDRENGAEAASRDVATRETEQAFRPQAAPTRPTASTPAPPMAPKTEATRHAEPDWSAFYT